MTRLFVQTEHCTSEVHCGACRNREGGRRTREWWASRYELPGGVDFDCPYGKPWGFIPPPRPAKQQGLTVPPEVVAEREAQCTPCPHNVDGVCLEYKRLRGGGCAAKVSVGVRVAKAACPIGKWPALVSPV